MDRTNRLCSLVIGILALSATASGTAVAQTGPVAGRVLMARLSRMLSDSEVQRVTHAKAPMDVMRWAPADALGRLSDQQLQDLMGLLARTVERASTSSCAAVWSQGIGNAFPILSADMDSALAEEWAALTEQMIRTGIEHRAMGMRVSRDSAFAVMVASVARFPSGDRSRGLQVLNRQITDSTDVCWFVRQIFAHMRRLPAKVIGPAQRTIMFGSPPP